MPTDESMFDKLADKSEEAWRHRDKPSLNAYFERVETNYLSDRDHVMFVQFAAFCVILWIK
jgi:hypothetical protein